jgi:hypothetical protein
MRPRLSQPPGEQKPERAQRPEFAIRQLMLVGLALFFFPAVAAADEDFTACPAYAPAFAVTDQFMTTFNARDIAAHEAPLHFPHVRIASGRVTVLPEPGGDAMARSYEQLLAAGWDHSAWADRRIVQCDATKAHMLTTFVRYRADGSELSRFDSLYIVEFKDGRWAVTGRSSYAQ